jgi:hypothetical protein
MKFSNIFESSQYQSGMFFAMILVSLLIMFSVANIFETNQDIISEINYKSLEKKMWDNQIDNQKLNNKQERSKGITGQVVSDEENSDEINGTVKINEPQEIYTEKAYFYYYLALLILGIGSLILAAWILLPKMKKYT